MPSMRPSRAQQVGEAVADAVVEAVARRVLGHEHDLAHARAASARTSLAMSSTLRLRCLPRSVGMMQNEQV